MKQTKTKSNSQWKSFQILISYFRKDSWNIGIWPNLVLRELSLQTFVSHKMSAISMSKLMTPYLNLAHWGRDKMAAISQTIFSNFLKGNVWISLKISPKFFPKFRINNITSLVQILACRRATSHYLNQWWLDCQRIYTSLDFNQLCKWAYLQQQRPWYPHSAHAPWSPGQRI